MFERLVDLAPGEGESQPFLLHDRDGLKASVAAELAALLSTRLSRPLALPPGQDRTTLDYGIPDAAGLAPGDAEGRAAFAAEIQAAILAFEPRLETPRVTLSPDPARSDGLMARIEAHLRCGDEMEPVSFALALGRGDES
ncbi:type VI secretion system baseplate subunit TssE [Phaeospirillum tilakii]|uniref:Type VI secretion system baseplate subunit TssE n=1 Tax=Phaeospirillum tilakii TaxID=741673 RepID=A0ABW5C729_9PROT